MYISINIMLEKKEKKPLNHINVVNITNHQTNKLDDAKLTFGNTFACF